MSPRILVFDVGNVLIRWDARHLFRKLLADEDAIDRFLHAIDFHEWNLAQDRGRLFADGVAHVEAQHPHYAHIARAYDERWQEAVPGVIEGSVALLDKMRAAGVPLYAITNFSGEKWADTVVRFPFLGEFRDVVVSGHEKMLKPEPEIYQLLLKRNGLAAKDCVFIDDSLKNVDGARAVGMHAVHFTSPGQMAAELAQMGFPA